MENNKYTNLFNLVQCLSITVDALIKAIQLAELSLTNLSEALTHDFYQIN